MADNEIIKAWGCCIPMSERKCNECPYHEFRFRCITQLIKDTIDLINRQQAEIERLKSGIDDLDRKLSMADDCIAEKEADIVRFQKKVEELSEVLSDSIRIRYKEIKSEAIKAFAERLKEKKHELDRFILYDEDIDNLVKEMGGDT